MGKKRPATIAELSPIQFGNAAGLSDTVAHSA
jgi:hypothetical protein